MWVLRRSKPLCLLTPQGCCTEIVNYPNKTLGGPLPMVNGVESCVHRLLYIRATRNVNCVVENKTPIHGLQRIRGKPKVSNIFGIFLKF